MSGKGQEERAGGCRLCPRECGAHRRGGAVGICGQDERIYVARAALHMWEEPCISGTAGSGAVFFSGCPLGCVFCQNRAVSRGGRGKEVSKDELAEMFLGLQRQGAANINLVTPTHYVDQAAEAVRKAEETGLCIPVVYNTGGYEKTDSLRLMDGLADIYLPDMKYRDDGLAKRYSGVEGYFETAARALAEMVRQVGEPVFDAAGMMKKGVIVRHLVLPGHTRDSMEIIRYLHDSYGESIYISILNQFTPVSGLERYPEINRSLTRREYEKVVDFALAAGVENAYIQEGGTVSESFIPDFL